MAEDNGDEILSSINFVIAEIKEIISRYRSGRIIKEGVKVAILGKPNTGKSSLLNSLLNYDKAIVSSVAGTTRDIVEGEIRINGIKFYLSDTAGLRESDDEVESVGIERARKTVRGSDILIVVLDGSGNLTKEDESALKETEGAERIIVANKTDIGDKGITADIKISALTGDNVEKLKEMLYERAVGGKIDLNGDFLTEERHYYALKSALDYLESASENFGKDTLEITASDINSAWESLGEVSGLTANEKIIDEIFSKFCVGK